MRLVIVSNRLPVTLGKSEDGHINIYESVGGLATGLTSFLSSTKNIIFDEGYIWVGWPGMEIPEYQMQQMAYKMEEYSCHPVFLPAETAERFYYGFCNNALWPLFHCLATNIRITSTSWDDYKKANEIFCEKLLKILKQDDVLWINDYHLLLLPGMIRQRLPDLPIGFFLHIPFPPFEMLQILPADWRRDIMEGLLGSDLIGFHTNDYAQNFLRCAIRIMGLGNVLGRMVFKSRLVYAAAFAMGIDYEKFHNSAQRKDVQDKMAVFKSTIEDRKAILSIDRLDYTKGIPEKLKGYERFLERYPFWRGKVNLILVVVPSRTSMEEYKNLKINIDMLVGRINSEFGSIAWTPVIYYHRYLKDPGLLALYKICEVGLITPLRDGMNLIAKEFVSSKSDQKGVLILSEMAGFSKEAGEAIIINPNNIDQIANAINQALQMTESEQIRRNQNMQNRLEKNNIFYWANAFVNSLRSISNEQKSMKVKMLDNSQRQGLIDAFKKATRRLIFSDYDGTLVPFADHPELAKPDQRLLNLLEKITEDPRNCFVLISGRKKEILQEWFGDFKLCFAAEHGAWIKENEGAWEGQPCLDGSWMAKVKTIMDGYVDKVPGSFVEEKEFSLCWHFRKAEMEIASLQSKELMEYLLSLTANTDIRILPGNMVIEVRNYGMDKGNAVSSWLDREKYDFILALGDDFTDEDMFRSLPKSAYSIKVGSDKSTARFNIPGQSDVLALLEEIAK